jgi:dolichol-phosphate mannosyltransferase
MSSSVQLSIVSPVYNGKPYLVELVKQIHASLGGSLSSYEIIFVDDGSPDGAWSTIESLCESDSKVRGLRLSRNFGQHIAITAGLAHAKGDFVAVMDSDLQDDPAFLPKLLDQAKAGIDIVFTEKSKRAHSGFKNIGAWLFTKLFNWLSQSPEMNNRTEVGNFSMLSQKAVQGFLAVKDCKRHYLMAIEHRRRPSGKSSYTFSKLVKHALEGITFQSDRLLYLSVGIGLGFFGLSILCILYLVIQYFVSGFKEGWTSLVVLILMSTGLILMSLGVVGIYIGKIFEQVKERPLFLVQESIGFDGIQK